MKSTNVGYCFTAFEDYLYCLLMLNLMIKVKASFFRLNYVLTELSLAIEIDLCDLSIFLCCLFQSYFILFFNISMLR